VTVAPLPPLPNLEALAATAHPVLADLAIQLGRPRVAIAFYDDSPYVPSAEPEEQP